MCKAAGEAAMVNGQQNEDGILTPSPLYISALKYYKNEFHAKLLDTLHDIAGTLTVNAPTFADFEHPDLHDGLETMLSTSTLSAEQRLRLFHYLRDTTADAYGGWSYATCQLRAAVSTHSGSSPCVTSTCSTRRAWRAESSSRVRRRFSRPTPRSEGSEVERVEHSLMTSNVPTIDLDRDSRTRWLGSRRGVPRRRVLPDRHHGFPQDVADAAWSAATAFFDLPLEERMSVADRPADTPTATSRWPRRRSLDLSDTHGAPDLKEVFNVGPVDPPGSPHRRPRRG
jgi:hypothetical protein